VKSALDCIPCLVRQALETARFVSPNEDIHLKVMRRVLRLTADMDMSDSPPAVARQIHSHLRDITGVDDPYLQAKQRFNRMALDMLPELYQRLKTAADPFALAVRLAIAGNVIDMGVYGDLTPEQARDSISVCLQEPFCGDIAALKQAIDRAGSILYLTDNAGEIAFDRLLVEQLPRERVTLAVKGGPVINDAVLADAREVGLPDLVTVIDNGARVPGTILPACSPAFRRTFEQADLIIAKGQGNFESLSDVQAPIFFLFKVKCRVIADHVGLATGTHLVLDQEDSCLHKDSD